MVWVIMKKYHSCNPVSFTVVLSALATNIYIYRCVYIFEDTLYILWTLSGARCHRFSLHVKGKNYILEYILLIFILSYKDVFYIAVAAYSLGQRLLYSQTSFLLIYSLIRWLFTLCEPVSGVVY